MVHTKRRHRVIVGKGTSSESPSAAKENGVTCMHAALAQVTNSPSRPWPFKCAMVGGAGVMAEH